MRTNWEKEWDKLPNALDECFISKRPFLVFCENKKRNSLIQHHQHQLLMIECAFDEYGKQEICISVLHNERKRTEPDTEREREGEKCAPRSRWKSCQITIWCTTHICNARTHTWTTRILRSTLSSLCMITKNRRRRKNHSQFVHMVDAVCRRYRQCGSWVWSTFFWCTLFRWSATYPSLAIRIFKLTNKYDLHRHLYRLCVVLFALPLPPPLSARNSSKIIFFLFASSREDLKLHS